jgi:hypothetical protein
MCIWLTCLCMMGKEYKICIVKGKCALCVFTT